MLFFTDRTEGYRRANRSKASTAIFEATGDFVSAVFRVMPHANEPERFKRIVGQMKSVKPITLSEFRGGEAKPIDDIDFPAVGQKDADIFENNLLEVMQFVFNHTTFDPDDEIDQELLAAYKPLGVVPGQAYDAAKVAKIDGKRFREVAERIFKENMAKAMDPEFQETELPRPVPTERRNQPRCSRCFSRSWARSASPRRRPSTRRSSRRTASR